MNSIRSLFSTLSLLSAATLALAATPARSQEHGAHDHAHHAMRTPSSLANEALEGLSIPDVPVLDQDGKTLHFYSDLVKDRLVVMNFVFTTCTTICPPMGANFAKLQRELSEHAGQPVQMISVSVDPAVDTPERLHAWADKFGRQEGWTLVTGAKPEIDRLLKGLEVFTPLKEDHSPIVLLGNDARGEWVRAYGLAEPGKLVELLDELGDNAAQAAQTSQTSHDAPAPEVEASHRPSEDSAARSYFTDVELIDHNGHKQRLYSDLLAGRVVVIASMFTDCAGVCPVTMNNLKRLQEWLGPRLGEEVRLLALTVDPKTDDPAMLKRYAEKLAARPGWYFLTGERDNLDFALRKLGLWVEDRESHAPIFLVGNVPTGLWKKALGLATAPELIAILDSVLEDRLEPAAETAREGR